MTGVQTCALPIFTSGTYDLQITTAGGGFQVTEATGLGDGNVIREQGQILIHSNRITNSLQAGIVADAGARDGTGNSPHQGTARTTREVNTSGLVPGLVIANNVVAGNDVGIRFRGDANAAGQQEAAIAFGRITNNTVVGGSIGIDIGVNASPTLLNNIVADAATGIAVDATSTSTVIGGTLYRGNTTNTTGITGLGDFAIELTDPLAPLFVSEQQGNYYLAPGARAIDSSINSLPDRPTLVSVKGPLGIGLSPILAPATDSIGQTRVDDPTVPTPPGQGANVFVDRGALDRADLDRKSVV